LKNRLIRAGFPARLRSQGGGERDQCLVLDTIGELAGWYDKAVVAVVGGSFSRRINGHNPLEPAALGRPVVFGPWMAHFREESGALLASGGAVRVADATGLADALGFWLGDRKAARKAGGAARAVVVAGQGAVSRTMDLIEKACTGPLNL
jgi:3-deoxy-D-manno-octulosonic-acid transferase